MPEEDILHKGAKIMNEDFPPSRPVRRRRSTLDTQICFNMFYTNWIYTFNGYLVAVFSCSAASMCVNRLYLYFSGHVVAFTTLTRALEIK